MNEEIESLEPSKMTIVKKRAFESNRQTRDHLRDINANSEARQFRASQPEVLLRR